MASSTNEPSKHIYGIDVSDTLTSRQWNCLAERNAKFAVVRSYRNAENPRTGNYGIPDTGCPSNVKYAHAAGLQFVDLYFFPVIRSKTVEEQVYESLAFLRKNNVSYRRMWLDVEGKTDQNTWYPQVNTNIDFIQLFILLMQQNQVDVGIYTGTDDWQAITNNSHLFKDVPLWWSSHGKDFASFGGWQAPAMVQYAYNTEHCGANYDSDYVDDPPA